MSAILEARSVSKSYGGFVALKDVSFGIAERSSFAIIGPNGAGKTTLFRVLTGEVLASSGQCLFHGHDISRLPANDRVRLGLGRTFQVARVFPDYSALNNVVVAIESRNRSYSQSRWSIRPGTDVLDEAAEWLSMLGLLGMGATQARHLALGDRKRLELALTLALEPVVLLLDEPTAGMSPSERHAIVDVVQRIKSELDLTIVLTEHDMDFVFRLSDTLMVMNHGEVIAIGKPLDIRENPLVREIYLGKEMVDA